MLKADLHLHSTVSDGSDSIPQIIAAAKKNGLDAIAITDHDTLAHQRLIPPDAGITVLAGVELSAIDPATGIKAHVLGYQIRDVALLEAFARPVLERRHQNCLRQIEILNQNGYAIRLEELNKANGQYLYKQHIMEYLFHTGQAPSMFGAFYQSIFKGGGICDFDITYLDVFEAVKTIRAAGGKAVLAHSGQQRNFYLIDKLVPLGLEGLEYQHPANGMDAKKIILSYAQKYGLFLTGGSDYHGKNEAEPVEIGAYLAEESGVNALCRP